MTEVTRMRWLVFQIRIQALRLLYFPLGNFLCLFHEMTQQDKAVIYPYSKQNPVSQRPKLPDSPSRCFTKGSPALVP